MRKSLGPVWFPLSVKLEHAAPSDIRLFRETFGPGLEFNQPTNSITLKKDDLIYPMPKSDEKLWKYLISLADEVREKQQGSSDIVSAVQRIIIEALPRDEANIKYVSEKIGKSPRTLQRELTSADTSFSKILEQTRQELADKYLLDSDLHISQITFLLGFSEVSVFTRAANRWFGISPSIYRLQNKRKKQA
ncbi:MAG: helix-turn-helix domain-containing protein, partial [Methyloligellaceae bacterium]